MQQQLVMHSNQHLVAAAMAAAAAGLRLPMLLIPPLQTQQALPLTCSRQRVAMCTNSAAARTRQCTWTETFCAYRSARSFTSLPFVAAMTRLLAAR